MPLNEETKPSVELGTEFENLIIVENGTMPWIWIWIYASYVLFNYLVSLFLSLWWHKALNSTTTVLLGE